MPQFCTLIVWLPSINDYECIALLIVVYLVMCHCIKGPVKLQQFSLPVRTRMKHCWPLKMIHLFYFLSIIYSKLLSKLLSIPCDLILYNIEHFIFWRCITPSENPHICLISLPFPNLLFLIYSAFPNLKRIRFAKHSFCSLNPRWLPNCVIITFQLNSKFCSIFSAGVNRLG